MARTYLCKAAALKPGQLRRIMVADTAICLAHVENAFYAVEDRCSHEAVPLSEGELVGLEVECPEHLSRFDLRTGAARRLPAVEPIRTFAVVLDGDDLYLAED